MDTGEHGHRTAEHAYFLWEQEGRPEGRAIDHWLKAEAELATMNLVSRPPAGRLRTKRSARKAA